jgi:MoaA/NifB/PqqE/SkfB family radical SAM enzyme
MPKVELIIKAPLHMVTWRCTRRCVGNCLYCSYTREYAKDAEVYTKTAYKIIDEIYDFGSPLFGISGAEPLLRQDIFDIVEYAKQIGFGVSLITSGFAFYEKRLNA